MTDFDRRYRLQDHGEHIAQNHQGQDPGKDPGDFSVLMALVFEDQKKPVSERGVCVHGRILVKSSDALTGLFLGNSFISSWRYICRVGCHGHTKDDLHDFFSLYEYLTPGSWFF